MILSNFISESERHEELYQDYNKKHLQVLSVFEKARASVSIKSNLENALKQEGLGENEIEWLKRTGHYFPSVC